MEKLPEMFIRNEEEQPKVSYNEFSEEDIPTISLAEENKSLLLERVRNACIEWGAFQITDHGIPPQVIQDTHTLSHEFFDLPNEEKLAYCAKGATGFRVGALFAGHKSDFRQRFLFKAYPIADRDYSLWPRAPEGWRDAVDKFSQEIMNVNKAVLGIVSESMGLDNNALLKACDVDLEQLVQMNFYPKCPMPDMVLGLKPHTDSCALTILSQDLVGGLQVKRDEASEWMTVKPVEGALVVVVGECLHILSNGRFKLLLHRAVVNSKEKRMSIVAFHYPSPKAEIYPISEMMKGGEPPIVEESKSFTKWWGQRMANQSVETDSYKPEEILSAISKCSTIV